MMKKSGGNFVHILIIQLVQNNYFVEIVFIFLMIKMSSWLHFLAVSREGRVFGRGSNSCDQLSLGQQTSDTSSFTLIFSLKDHKIREVYAGYRHSLFETSEGKILACGSIRLSCLLLSSDTNEKETTISVLQVIV